MKSDFIKYLEKFSRSQLLDTVLNTYIETKGFFSGDAKCGYNGCKEFATLIMLLNYYYDNKLPLIDEKKYLTSYFSLLTGFGLACVGCPPLEWSDYMDSAIANEGSTITEDDWMDGYRFFDKLEDELLITNNIGLIKVYKYPFAANRDYFSRNVNFENYSFYINSKMKIKSNNFYLESIKYFIDQGFNLKRFLDFSND